MNILITGGSGFIGGYVYRYLKGNKYHVKNFDIIGNDQDPDFIHGSITDIDGHHSLSNGKIGPYTKKLKELLVGIQRQEIDDDFGWIIPVE